MASLIRVSTFIGFLEEMIKMIKMVKRCLHVNSSNSLTVTS